MKVAFTGLKLCFVAPKIDPYLARLCFGASLANFSPFLFVHLLTFQRRESNFHSNSADKPFLRHFTPFCLLIGQG